MTLTVEPQALADVGTKLAERYRTASPFPHVVIRNFWDEHELRRVAEEVKSFDLYDGEKDFYGSRRKRFCSTYGKLPPLSRNLIDRCHTPEFLKFLEAMTGHVGLVADPGLTGAGIHSSGAGGFLKVHADFNWHAELGMYRRLNLLIYLNPQWQADWGGALELWSRDMSRSVVSVQPECGVMVIFTTDDTSFHGHPEPMRCPIDVTRDSIALYYYSPATPEEERRQIRRSTDYRRRNDADFNS